MRKQDKNVLKMIGLESNSHNNNNNNNNNNNSKDTANGRLHHFEMSPARRR